MKRALLLVVSVIVLGVVAACGLDSGEENNFEVQVLNSKDGKISFTLEKGTHLLIPVSHSKQEGQNIYTISAGAEEPNGSGASPSFKQFNGIFAGRNFALEHALRNGERNLIESGLVYDFVEYKRTKDTAECTSDLTCGGDEFCDGGVCRSELELYFRNPLSPADYQQFTAKVERVSEISVIVVDNECQVDSNTIERIGRAFDSVIYPRDMFFFGQNLEEGVLDIDGNGRIIIALTCKLNQVEGFAGFFDAHDLIKRSDSNPSSNERDMFFAVVPDDNNPTDLVLATLAHEFQHMLNFAIRALTPAKQGKDAVFEKVWLNEGLSHLAEDLSGFGKDTAAFVAAYLEEPTEYSLVSGQDTPGNRGMAYLYLRYLFEQQGGVDYSNTSADDLTDKGGAAFLNKLYTGEATGLDNIESALDSDYKESFHNWLVAVAVANLGLTDDAKFTYQNRFDDPITGQPHGVCLFCTVATTSGEVELQGALIEEFSDPDSVDDRYTSGVGADFIKFVMTDSKDYTFDSDAFAAFSLIVINAGSSE